MTWTGYWILAGLTLFGLYWDRYQWDRTSDLYALYRHARLWGKTVRVSVRYAIVAYRRGCRYER